MRRTIFQRVTIAMTLGFTPVIFASPHFYLQMENKTDQNVTISFKKEVGNVYLEPTLPDETPLAAHTLGAKYEVHIEPMERTATFNVHFTGRQYCQYNISFYGPGNPKVTVSGPGCHGGGYRVLDHTLLLYVSDIRRS
ncbi:MAG: hypothetical protein H0W64_00150 [Gammaproteobacteria bacterium]|nr:hypothetical protein [Gammaproteobacteria bacterium]